MFASRLFALPLALAAITALATHMPMPPSPTTAYDFSARLNDGTETSLSSYRGKVLLIVNTASHCGFTPQYEGLEALYERYHDRGLEVLAFPANNFLHQEPGTDAEIETFCKAKFGVSFPLFAKISVKGRGIHPLYAWLTHESGFPGDIGWNFNKFLVGPDGHVVARFDSRMKPQSAEVTDAIDRLLANR